MLDIPCTIQAILCLPLLKGGFNVNRKEAQLEKSERFSDHESYVHFRATHVWYGPHSPILDHKDSVECKYRHIFFPTKI
jgi:hypothetical protein